MGNRPVGWPLSIITVSAKIDAFSLRRSAGWPAWQSVEPHLFLPSRGLSHALGDEKKSGDQA